MCKVAVILKTMNDLSRARNIDEDMAQQGVSYRLYVHTEGYLSEDDCEIVELLRARGHTVIVPPAEERFFATCARNSLVSLTEGEPFLLRVDDDFRFPVTSFSLRDMISVLERVPNIDVVASIERQMGRRGSTKSGELSAAQGFFSVGAKNKTLIKHCVHPSELVRISSKNCPPYAFVHHSRNCLLIRSKVFESIQWNEDLKVQGEHFDFMFQLYCSNFSLAVVPGSIHIHDELNYKKSAAYKIYRHANLGEELRLENLKKLGFTGVSNVRLYQASALSILRQVLKKIRKFL